MGGSAVWILSGVPEQPREGLGNPRELPTRTPFPKKFDEILHLEEAQAHGAGSNSRDLVPTMLLRA